MALIYDVGMHDGEDTAFYLHQGHTVIAVDANPDSAAKGAVRFRKEIGEGHLTILNLAIAEQPGEMEFWVCDSVSMWSSFNRDIASRYGSKHHSVMVRTVRFSEILAQFGCPHYLKVDIEGYDYLCLEDLDTQNKPRYVSVETGGTLRLLDLLKDRGYTRFKLIRQRDFFPLELSPVRLRVYNAASDVLYRKRFWPLRKLGARTLLRPLDFRARVEKENNWKFPEESSGPWGNDTPGRWLTFDEAKQTCEYCRAAHLKKFGRGLWCDWHATF